MEFQPGVHYLQTDDDYDPRKVTPVAVLVIGGVLWFHGLGAALVALLAIGTVWVPMKQGKETQILPITVAWMVGVYIWMIGDGGPVWVTVPMVVGLLAFIVVEMYLQSD